MSDAPEELWNVLQQYLEAEGLELDDLEIVGGSQGRQTLRVTVDADGGVGIDRLGESSRGLSRLLDQHEVISGPYNLELSSPGLERKLRLPAHWMKSVGRDVTVKFRIDVDGRRRHDGTLVSADETGFVLSVDGTELASRYDDVTSARTVFAWGPAARPGKQQ